MSDNTFRGVLHTLPSGKLPLPPSLPAHLHADRVRDSARTLIVSTRDADAADLAGMRARIVSFMALHGRPGVEALLAVVEGWAE